MMLTGMLTNTGNFRCIRHLFSENSKMYRKKKHAGRPSYTTQVKQVKAPSRKPPFYPTWSQITSSYDTSFVFHIRILLPSANGPFYLDFYDKNIVRVYHFRPHSYMSVQWHYNVDDLLYNHHRHNYHHNITEIHWFRVSNCSGSTSRYKLNVLEAL